MGGRRHNLVADVASLNRMRLFHFSDDPTIAHFEPRPVLQPSPRPAGRAWLNGPLVWAIEERRQALYLFPRDCPRILLWPTEATTAGDREHFWQGGDWRMIAYVEEAWLGAIARAALCRYELPVDTFESLNDAGMWVSHTPVTPLGRQALTDLQGALAEESVDLRALPTLTLLRDVWTTTLHASGIRLRNAQGWA
jgi:hypothetical protein